MDKLHDDMAKLDRGEHIYNKPEEQLMKLKGGQKIDQALSGCTICPVGNATCLGYFIITVCGTHPEKKSIKTNIPICTIGVQDVNLCPLNK